MICAQSTLNVNLELCTQVDKFSEKTATKFSIILETRSVGIFKRLSFVSIH